jgi:hypothetical protein
MGEHSKKLKRGAVEESESDQRRCGFDQRESAGGRVTAR